MKKDRSRCRSFFKTLDHFFKRFRRIAQLPKGFKGIGFSPTSAGPHLTGKMPRLRGFRSPRSRSVFTFYSHYFPRPEEHYAHLLPCNRITECEIVPASAFQNAAAHAPFHRFPAPIVRLLFPRFRRRPDISDAVLLGIWVIMSKTHNSCRPLCFALIL